MNFFSLIKELTGCRDPNHSPTGAHLEFPYVHETCLSNWKPRDKWAYCTDLDTLATEIPRLLKQEYTKVDSRLKDLHKTELDQLDLIVKPTEPLPGRNRNQVFEPANAHVSTRRASRPLGNIASRLDYTTIDKEKLRNHERPRINLIEEYQMVSDLTNIRVNEIASAIKKVTAGLRSCPDDHIKPSFWMSLRASLVSMSIEHPSLDLPSGGEFLSGEELVRMNMQLLGMQTAITCILTAAHTQGDRLFSDDAQAKVVSGGS